MNKEFNWVREYDPKREARGLKAKREYVRTARIIQEAISPFHLSQIAIEIGKIWQARKTKKTL